MTIQGAARYASTALLRNWQVFESIFFNCLHEYNEGLKMVTKLTQHGGGSLSSNLSLYVIACNEGRIIVYSLFLRRDSEFGAYS